MSSWLQLFRRSQLTAPALPAASRWPLIAGVILAIMLSLLLYADTLSVPFLQEDSFHIRWLSDRSVLQPFWDATGAPDYRPLGKAIIKGWYEVLGRHDRVWLRYHNIVFNALNIALVGAIASWLDTSRRRYVTGATAALLFGTLPFAYQAIPWINNFFYPLANLLLLLMTAVYWQARVRHSNRLLVLALLLCFLAPFEIEYGLMASGVLFALELALWLQGRQPRPWLTGPLLGLGMNLLFLARSLTIPKDTYAFGLPTFGRLKLIATYFMQGLMYPVSTRATDLMRLTGWGDVAAIWTIALPVLLALVAYLLVKRQAALVVMALLWFGLLNLPALVFVDFDYVVNSPRLLYPPGVGIAWLWGGALAAFALSGSPRQRPYRIAATAVFAALVVGMSIGFVRERVDQYHLIEEPALELVETARTAPDHEPLIVVNFPSWMAPTGRSFAMGNHGIQIIPFYINIQELIYAHNDADHAARAVQFANVRPELPYYYGMLGEQMDYERLRDVLLSGDTVYLTQWGPQRIELWRAGRVGVDRPAGPLATFDGGMQLGSGPVERADDRLQVPLTWALDTAVARDLTVFVHLYAPDGSLVAQADGYPLLGLAPFWLWDAGQMLEDVRTIRLPDDLPAGTYRIGVGVYDPAVGERVTAVAPDGTPLPDNVAIVDTLALP